MVQLLDHAVLPLYSSPRRLQLTSDIEDLRLLLLLVVLGKQRASSTYQSVAVDPAGLDFRFGFFELVDVEHE